MVEPKVEVRILQSFATTTEVYIRGSICKIPANKLDKWQKVGYVAVVKKSSPPPTSAIVRETRESKEQKATTTTTTVKKTKRRGRPRKKKSE